ELSATQHKGLARVDSNARHLTTIIKRDPGPRAHEAGKMPLHLSTFKIRDVIARSGLAVTRRVQSRTGRRTTSPAATASRSPNSCASLLERQAIRRMEGGTLTAEETEAVGLALMRLEATVRELAARFGLTPEDLNSISPPSVG
ncbi:MAG: gas vesicle protein K, partial [Planctomycetota bacterium]